MGGGGIMNTITTVTSKDNLIVDMATQEKKKCPGVYGFYEMEPDEKALANKPKGRGWRYVMAEKGPAWVRIRKLTPRECGRLMNVDEDKLDKVVFEISKPAIKITRMLVESNYVGGIDTTINFTNLTKKEIAYITFTVKYYDRMGYPAVCRIKDVSTMSLNYTGPFKAGASESALWEAVIYHAPTAAIKPLSAEVIFTDGEVQNLEYGGWYWRMSDYYGGELHD